MDGLLQHWSLLNWKILDYAALQHGSREVVTRGTTGHCRRTTYKALHSQAKRMAAAFLRDGIKHGDRVATLAFNTAEHLATWYGLVGIGAIYHSVNPRLFDGQITHILNHARSRMLIVDGATVPVVEKVFEGLPHIEKIIVLEDKVDIPSSPLPLVAMDDWLDGCSEGQEWLEFDENSIAGLCYTSGTTGDPKGVTYTHRGNTLHALTFNSPTMMGVSMHETVLPVVPLFHANGWGLGFGVPMAGAKLVMPGNQLDGASIYRLLDDEKVTITAAVPTVWQGLLSYLREHPEKKLPNLKRVLIGGSACPRSLFEAFEGDYGAEVIHAWGMTELSPLGSASVPKPEALALDKEAQLGQCLKQGHPPYMVEMRIDDDAGNAQPWDGKSSGALKVKGPFIARAYYPGPDAEPVSILDENGFFDTGDIAQIDPLGYMQITDRAKDVIKSGGEWISSIDLENAAMGCPGVAEAAVVGIPHPKWDERPLLFVVPEQPDTLSKSDVLDYLRNCVAKWWLPDDVRFIDAIPHTATGKIDKVSLRASH